MGRRDCETGSEAPPSGTWVQDQLPREPEEQYLVPELCSGCKNLGKPLCLPSLTPLYLRLPPE